MIAVAIFMDTINSVLFSSNCVKVNTDLLSIVYNFLYSNVIYTKQISVQVTA